MDRPGDDRDLREVLPEYLDYLDDILAQADVPLSLRPIRAALLFVHEFIIEMEGGTKERCWEQPWFDSLWEDIDAWYQGRYGRRRMEKDETRPGLLLIYGTPFRVRIPLTFWSRVTDETGWLHIPNEVCPGEDPLTWIESPPNLQHLSDADRADLQAIARTIVEHTRSIHVDLLCATKKGARFSALADTTHSHLTKAINDILAASPHDLSVALWELHMAIEKALKAFLVQRDADVPHTHDLRHLHTLAVSVGLSPLDQELLDALPAERDSVRQRYGESDPLSVRTAYDGYLTALRVVHHCTTGYQRRIRMRNSALQLRRPKWRRRPAPGSRP